MLYRGYDQAGLDAQYFLRARVTDFQAYFDDYAARSAAARRDLACQLDVPYGPGPSERLDIFPAAHPKAPVHCFIHGGYWQAMDKSDFDYIATGLVPAGATVVVVNYALAPTVGMDEIVRQNRAALAWVWRHATSFGADPHRIYLSGHSAGGHLTAMLLSTDWRAVAADLPADLVKGGCSLSGLYDLEPIRLCYLNEKLGLDRVTAARNSPILQLPQQSAPLILSAGDQETDEFLRQQADYAAARKARNLPVELVAAPGLHHFSVVNELIRPASALHVAVRRQMGL